jgi:hypothetical protein
MDTLKSKPHTILKPLQKKCHAGWVGDKVQVTETEDEIYPQLITDIVDTGSNQTDYEELPNI